VRLEGRRCRPGTQLGQGIATDGRPAGRRSEIRLADEVPARGGDAEFVLSASEVLLRAAEAATAIVLDDAVCLANECPRGTVAQLDVLAVDQERYWQVGAADGANHDAIVVRCAASDGRRANQAGIAGRII